MWSPSALSHKQMRWTTASGVDTLGTKQGNQKIVGQYSSPWNFHCNRTSYSNLVKRHRKSVSFLCLCDMAVKGASKGQDVLNTMRVHFCNDEFRYWRITCPTLNRYGDPYLQMLIIIEDVKKKHVKLKTCFFLGGFLLSTIIYPCTFN